MNEDQIERAVERKFDRLDAAFMNSQTMSQADYDREAAEIHAWAESEYRWARLAG